MEAKNVFKWIAAVAVVALVGQEVYRRAVQPGADSSLASPAGEATTPAPTLPREWLTERALKAEKAMLGLTASQRYAVLAVMNQKPCDCGCPHGTTAKCLVEDPECPRAPVILTRAIELARQGQSADEIVAAVKARSVAGVGAPVAQGTQQRVEIPRWSPVQGPPNAKVHVVIFSDFQCPFCSTILPTVRKLVEKYPDDVQLVFRHEPLPSHANAEVAAEASMAAHAQGKFWKMHDLLFSNQDLLDRAHLEQFAAEIGLDVKRFKADLDGHTHLKNIQDDAAAGRALGVTGTPAMFINGRTIIGAQSADNVFGIVVEELKRADLVLKQGIPIEQVYDAVMRTIPEKPAPVP